MMNACLPSYETRCRTRSKRRHPSSSCRRVSEAGNAKSGHRVSNMCITSGWNLRTRSCALISSASLCILSIIHQAHADPSSLRINNQRALAFGVGSVIDNSCYDNLKSSDANGDGKLSQSEFVNFVQLSAEGKLDTNEYGIPITEFYHLPPEFIGIYNYFACGDANYGCPSVEGIDIAGVAEVLAGEGGLPAQQEVLLFQLCMVTEGGVDKLATSPPTGSPTAASPTNATGSVSPTDAPTEPTSSPTTTPPTTSPILPSCPELYDANNSISYGAGDLVYALDGVDQYIYYQCKPLPQGEWCGQASYAPGDGSLNWEEAWTLIGQCELEGEGAGTAPPTSFGPTASSGTSSSPTPKLSETVKFPSYSPTVSSSSPTPNPTSVVTTAAADPTAQPVTPTSPPTASKPITPTVDDSEEEPYSGPLATTFQYEIFNTQNLEAEGISTGFNPKNDMMAVLLRSTTTFVEDVVFVTFGTSVDSTNVVDHSKGNDLARVRNFTGVGEGIRRLLRGQSRGLEVLVEPNSVSINNIENVECSDQSLVTTVCQMITAATELTLVNETKNATALQFQNSINRALDDPGMTFPETSGIVYAGPASLSSNVVVIPGVTGPENPTEKMPPEEEKSGTPGWVVPVSIGAAAVGSVLLVLLVGTHMNKRNMTGKGGGKDCEGKTRQSMEGDLGESDGSFVAVVKIDGSDGNPLEDGENGNHSFGGGSSTNPFFYESSSGSDSSSAPSGPYPRPSSARGSLSSSSSASAEDIISDNKPKDFWKRREAEALQQQERNAGSALTFHKVSEENLSWSGRSLLSAASDDKSDKSVYRAGVEALVTEACPEKHNKIDEMMLEYEGREDVLIGYLSTMLAAKNRETASGTDTETSDEREGLGPPPPIRRKATRDDLNAAIEAGDWAAVGATAAHLAGSTTSQSDWSVSESDARSSVLSLDSSSYVSVSSHSESNNRTRELESMVETGDWEGVVLAAMKFDGGNATEEDTQYTRRRSTLTEGSNRKEEIRAEVEKVVRRVIPHDIENIDEMMLQFEGREEELILSLQNMQERLVAQRARAAVQKTANLEAKAKASISIASASGSSYTSTSGTNQLRSSSFGTRGSEENSSTLTEPS